MTRQEFDSRFAATQSTTNGWTDAELAEINAAVFAGLSIFDAHDDAAHDHAKNLFAREFDAR